MEIVSLAASGVASFMATLLFLPWLIRSLRGTTAVGKDLNKPQRPLIPEMGGLAVIIGFYVGVGVWALLAAENLPTSFIYAALVAVLGAGVVGLMDDIFGIRRSVKALFPFFLSLPLGIMSYTSGDVVLLGMNIGLLTVLVVPLGVTSAANAANMLEGLNGLGSGMGAIMTAALIVLAFITGSHNSLYFVFPLLGALLAFLLFNKYPARIFPGDSMTLFMGAAIASAAIISHQKIYGAILFAPMIAEFVLKARGRFRAENYGQPDGGGRLHHEGPIQSLTHLVMRSRPMKEWQIVATLWGLEAAIATALILGVVFWR